MLTIILCLNLGGCAKPKPPAPSSPAEEKLAKLISEEYNLKAVIKRAGATLWIYNPREGDFISLVATDEGSSFSSEAKESLAINFFDAKYKDNSIAVSYDIGRQKAYEKNYGYTTAYNEKCRADQQNILNAVYRSYADDKTPPQFIVLVVADIKTGIEMKTILAFSDLLRAYQDMSFYEEYVRRAVMDYPVGNKNIIGDAAGKHLDFYDISWGEFITRQINYRANFKYTRSAFRPGPDTEKEILNVIVDILVAYNFTAYKEIILNDLAAKTVHAFSKDEMLVKTKDYQANPPGKLIQLKFI